MFGNSACQKSKTGISPGLSLRTANYDLVTVELRLVRAFYRNPDVVRLALGKLCQLYADLFEMEPGNFFVQLLRQRVDVHLVRVLVFPKIELRQRLVREAVRHDEAGVSRRASQV